MQLISVILCWSWLLLHTVMSHNSCLTAWGNNKWMSPLQLFSVEASASFCKCIFKSDWWGPDGRQYFFTEWIIRNWLVSCNDIPHKTSLTTTLLYRQASQGRVETLKKNRKANASTRKRHQSHKLYNVTTVAAFISMKCRKVSMTYLWQQHAKLLIRFALRIKPITAEVSTRGGGVPLPTFQAHPAEVKLALKRRKIWWKV